MQKDALALLARRGGEALPIPGFPIACNQPGQRPSSGPFSCAQLARYGRVIFEFEVRRPEIGTQSNARALTDTDILNGFAVPSNFPMEGRRARAWQGAHHTTTSADWSQPQSARPLA